MSYNMDSDKLFVYTMASVRNLPDIIKELMIADHMELAIEFLLEEKKALEIAFQVLKDIGNKEYQNTFNEIIPDKLKDIADAIKFCSSRIVDGKNTILDQEQEYNYRKKKRESKIKGFKGLKNIAMNSAQWEFADYLDEQIKKEERNLYHA